MENLIPALPDALAIGKHPAYFVVSAGFEAADVLHLRADVAGHLAGSALPVLGYWLGLDEQSQPYGLRAYVRASRTEPVTYQTRTAARFPEAGQQERWLAGVPMYPFTEIDITDQADSLALERLAPVAAVPAVVVRPFHRPAAGLRKAA